MVDLNTMMRDQARAGLQTQLDAAVTNGDTAAATKIANDIATLAVSSAPKAPPFGHAEITAELDKQAWFGVDPERSALAVDLGKTMDPKKFPTAAAFAEALVKAVDKKLTPPAVEPKVGEGEGDGEGEDDGEGEGEPEPKPKKKSDGPGDGDVGNRSVSKGKSGPWTKITDAPPDIQKEVRRQADRFVSSTAPKEQREKFIVKALESHYNAAQRAKGKK